MKTIRLEVTSFLTSPLPLHLPLPLAPPPLFFVFCGAYGGEKFTSLLAKSSDHFLPTSFPTYLPPYPYLSPSVPSSLQSKEIEARVITVGR